MGDVVHVDFARRERRHVQHPKAGTCVRCPDAAYEAGHCAAHFAEIRIDQEAHQDRMCAELLSGSRCAACRQPIRARQMRGVMPSGGALHVSCAIAVAVEQEAVEAEGRGA